MITFETENLNKKLGRENFKKAAAKAILKIMSKMGISTLKSYCGAQIFDAIGISEQLVSKYFCGTSSLIGGIGLNQIQKETLERFNKINKLLKVTAMVVEAATIKHFTNKRFNSAEFVRKALQRIVEGEFRRG